MGPSLSWGDGQAAFKAIFDKPVHKWVELPYFGWDDRAAPSMGLRDMMRRVRVGLTGLACVFLLVMLATALVSVASDRNGNSITPTMNAAAPSEPLAQLGVAPGNPATNPAIATDPKAPRKH